MGTLYKPVAASFTMVVELLLLALLYFVVAIIYSSSYGDESILIVATLCVSFVASVANLLVFTACSFYRKSSVIRWQYYQSLTQATFCTILISSMMYLVGWIMIRLNQVAWHRAFFFHSSVSLLVHDVAGVMTLVLHMILLLVAGLGTYASTPEGSMNLLWFNPSCLVSLCVVWVIMFEVAEFGAMHCYASANPALVFVSVNVILSIFFLLQLLDVTNLGSFFGFKLPLWCKHVLPEPGEIDDAVQVEYRRILNGSKQESLSPSAMEKLEEELEEVLTGNQKAVVRTPTLYLWRCLSLILASSITVAPIVRLRQSARYTFESDEQIWLISLCSVISAAAWSLSLFMSIDFMQLIRPVMEPTVIVKSAVSHGQDDKPVAETVVPRGQPVIPLKISHKVELPRDGSKSKKL
jgi:hypothetical protein